MDKEKYLKQITKVIEEGPYQADWESLSHYKIPDWYDQIKFGIFIHWGIYSVPAFGNEWYSRNMYIQGSPEFEHHVATYGSQKEFGYKDFIPMFKAEKFDPDQWAKLFSEAGAQYVLPVAEHHDGFQMYQSEVSHWNAYEMGPKRDIVNELFQAFEKKQLVCGLSNHRVEHWFFMGHGKEFDSDITDQEQEGDFYWPAMEERDNYDIFSEPTPTKEFLEDWLVRNCELVDRFHPKIVYFDWWIQHNAVKPYLKQFAAYYYNQAAKRNEEVVINYKHDAFMFGTAVIDVERGQFAEIKPYQWQTDTAAAKNSWCYTTTNDYKKAKDLICDLIDIVSKNGRMLLNIGPKADGTIPDADRQILEQIGSWMKDNKEAIYGAHPWRVFGEGPTKVTEGQFSDGVDKVFTSEDIRYLVKGSKLYAAVLNYPDNQAVTCKELGEMDASKLPKFHGIIKDIQVLGYDEVPEWSRTKEGLTITTKHVKSEYPVIFALTLD